MGFFVNKMNLLNICDEIKKLIPSIKYLISNHLFQLQVYTISNI